MKRIRTKIDGVILLDKPSGISSNSAIQKVKQILNAEKVGHTGTLDPLATGLLPVCCGEATKFASFLLDGDKEYLAHIQLGVITDSGDSEGQILAHNVVNTDLAAIENALSCQRGTILQVPPLYSALKHNGKPLYEYARAGINIERQPRQVTIYELELIEYQTATAQLTLRARVSKGTYIRSLAHDLGMALGCGACLIGLRRTKTNCFNLQQGIDLEQLSSLAATGNWTQHLLPCDVLVNSLAAVEVDQAALVRLKYGNPTQMANYPQQLSGQQVRLYAGDLFLGIATLPSDKPGWIYPERMLANLALKLGNC